MNDVIVIYGKQGCRLCAEAAKLAKKKNYVFDYWLLDKHFVLDEFMRRFPEAKTFPQITWNGKAIGGYAEFKEIVGD